MTLVWQKPCCADTVHTIYMCFLKKFFLPAPFVDFAKVNCLCVCLLRYS